MESQEIDELRSRLERVEDELATRRVILSYGPAADAGPPLIDIDGDHATALNYSLVMRREERRYYLWRVSAVRWDLERAGSSWRVRRRTNRLLDDSGAGRHLFGDTLGGMAWAG